MALLTYLSYFLLFVVFLKAVEWLIRKQTFPAASLREKYILVTGCDSGFGRLLAKRLDLKGMHVIACCYTKEGMDSLKTSASSNLTTLLLDVAQHQSVLDCYEAVKKILPAGSGLWGIVNNAGVPGFLGPLDWTDVESYTSIVRVNLLGVVDMTLTFLPLIYKANGRVVNVSSSYGRFPILTCGYTESKYGVEAFTDGLRMHFKSIGSKCMASVLEPAHFQTTMADVGQLRKALYEKYSNTRPEIKAMYPTDYKKYIDRFADINTKIMKFLQSPRLHLVVDAYEHALVSRYPKKRYAVGWDARFIWVPFSYLPSCITDLIFVPPKRKIF